MKKTVLLALVLFSLCFVSLQRLQIAYASPYTDIDVDTAYNMITNGSFPDLVVLDVRYQYEYDAGHIYRAVWIPYDELDGRIGELAGHENHEIIVYCKAGSRSAIASGTLDSHNFTKVYNMLGGMDAWQLSYPVWIATVHNLNTTFNYDTIQAAIDTPQTLDGHTISVDAGTYYENVVVNKTVTLIGESKHNTTIDGSGTGTVIKVTANNVNISGFTIQNSGNPECGILVDGSSGNNITNNIITNNYYGVYLSEYSNSIISGNNVTNNIDGIVLYDSSNNIIYHNNFVDNTGTQVYSNASVNVWDDGYPSGGNYWSDQYHGDCADHRSGPSQHISGSDGIVDDPYEIDANNRDRYPLMEPWPCEITPQFPVGGIHVPVDKLSLLAPYIALVSTIIIAIAVTAFFSKYRKKQ